MLGHGTVHVWLWVAAQAAARFFVGRAPYPAIPKRFSTIPKGISSDFWRLQSDLERSELVRGHRGQTVIA